MPNFFCRPAFTQGEDNAIATRTPPKKKLMNKTKPTTKPVSKVRPEATAAVIEKPVSMAVSPLAAKPKESAKEREARERRREALQQMLLQKRQEILKEIEGSPGQSLTEDQQRRLESARCRRSGAHGSGP
jgi:DnaK suppressor protein